VLGSRNLHTVDWCQNLLLIVVSPFRKGGSQGSLCLSIRRSVCHKYLCWLCHFYISLHQTFKVYCLWQHRHKFLTSRLHLPVLPFFLNLFVILTKHPRGTQCSIDFWQTVNPCFPTLSLCSYNVCIYCSENARHRLMNRSAGLPTSADRALVSELVSWNAVHWCLFYCAY